jgi:hypothetical protein
MRKKDEKKKTFYIPKSFAARNSMKLHKIMREERRRNASHEEKYVKK